MQNKETYFNFLESIVTKNEHSQILEGLTKLISIGDMEGFVKESSLSEVSVNLFEMLRPFINNGRIEVSELRDLEKMVSDLGCVYLKLSFYPKVQFIRDIHRKLLDISKDKIYIDFTIDPSILGGVQIEYKGQFFDGSLKKVIDENFNNKKDIILNLIK